MPYLMIKTNQCLDEARLARLLKEASRTAAAALGKPESYVMVAVETNTPMLFGGSDAPLAYLELKSLGLPESRTADLSAALTETISAELNVEKDRIYIEFADAARHMWGWKGGTF
jgi:phenylpyruvate tautomerase PptA (4-oxalocrotonate tautomerase family)